jgi:hypothetical protein
MVKDLYAEFECPEAEYAPDFDITIKITKENHGWEKKTKVKKEMEDEEKEKIRAENEEKVERNGVKAKAIADRISCFKRDYIGAPIRNAMNACLAGKQEFKPLEIPYRQDEYMWVFQNTPEDCQVMFSLNL